MKKCFKCGDEKPIIDFYKHPQMADGRVNKCKECNKKDVRENRNKNIDYYRRFDRKRGNRHGPDYSKEYRAKNPEKYKAHNMINNAIRDGKIKPLDCESCGADKSTTHGHHDDYSKPMEVRWLCPVCHHQWHAKHGEGLNHAQKSQP